MTERARPNTVLAFLCFLLVPSTAGARDLTGLWATDASKCDNVFTRNGNNFSVARDADLHGSGFIIDGRRIVTQLAKCDIKTSKEDGQVTHLMLSCATDVMLSNVQASFKVVSDDRLLRIFPGGSDMEIPYERCTLK
jgi:hypothetical protein